MNTRTMQYVQIPADQVPMGGIVVTFGKGDPLLQGIAVEALPTGDFIILLEDYSRVVRHHTECQFFASTPDSPGWKGSPV